MEVYDNSMSPEDLEKLTGDLKLVRKEEPRAPTRAELRQHARTQKAQVRRYHQIVSGAEKAAVEKRRAKKKRAKKAQKVNRVR